MQSDYSHGAPKSQSCDMSSSIEQKESSETKSSAEETILLKVSDLEDKPMCRICWRGTSQESLLKPCNCKGTVEYVHRNCLESWLEFTNKETCELCHHHFTTRRTRKSVWDWWRQLQQRGDKWCKFAQFIYCVFITPFVIYALWICAVNIIKYQKMKNMKATIILVIAAVILALTYLFFLMGTILDTRDYFMMWRQWREQNWHVRIVDWSSASPQMSVQVSVISIPPQSRPFIRLQIQDSRECPAYDPERNMELGVSGNSGFSGRSYTL